MVDGVKGGREVEKTQTSHCVDEMGVEVLARNSRSLEILSVKKKANRSVSASEIPGAAEGKGDL